MRRLKISDRNKLWFTSDTHFGHSNVIKYSNRPFKTAQEMDESMIKSWNNSVSADDDIVILGDFSFHDKHKTEEILKQLNGIKHFVWGNHDKVIEKNYYLQKYFTSVNDMLKIKVDDEYRNSGVQEIICCHYAMSVWDKSHYTSWNLFGHSHGSFVPHKDSRQLDVGVDCWNWAPVSYNTLREIMKEKLGTFVDHHTGER